MKKIKTIFLFSAAAAVAGGCMVGPDYENPNESVAEKEILDFAEYANDGGLWKTANPQDSQSRGDWWDIFGDETLAGYMRMCAEKNPDLKSVYYKVEQAREYALIKRGDLLPHATASGDWFKNEVGNRSILRPLGSQFEDWAVGATLTWDADLFGRIRSTLEASRADAQALQMEYENALMSLRTKTAALYFSLREAESLRQLLEETVKTRESETAQIRARYEMATATDADVQRAIEQEFSTKAQLTDVLEQIALAKNMLANLLGTVPAKISIDAAPLDKSAPAVPASIPSELLEKRPDIAAAERAVCAANYRIGAAQAAFFPTVSITSSLGTESTAFSKLLNSSSFAWGVSPQIYIPIFQAGKLTAQKRVALAKHKETLEKYKATVLKAVREVEDALAKSEAAAKRAAERETAANAAAKVGSLVRDQYEAGVADYFAVCEARRYALAAKIALVKSRGDQYRAAVELIRAVNL